MKREITRDPGRIPEIIAELQDLWIKYPDLRLTQLILNLHIDPDVLYYIEDKQLIKMLKESYKEGDNRGEDEAARYIGPESWAQEKK